MKVVNSCCKELKERQKMQKRENTKQYLKSLATSSANRFEPKFHLARHVTSRFDTSDVSSPCISAMSSWSNSTARHARLDALHTSNVSRHDETVPSGICALPVSVLRPTLRQKLTSQSPPQSPKTTYSSIKICSQFWQTNC